MAKLIPLTQGYRAVVDDEDYAWLSQYNWFAVVHYKTYTVRVSAARKVKGRQQFMARLLLGIEGLDWRTAIADHIDRDPLNNQRSNLRIVNNSQNLQNRRGACVTNLTGIRGVRMRGGKYRVQVGRKAYGTYDTLEEAEQVAIETRRQVFTHSEMDRQ